MNRAHKLATLFAILITLTTGCGSKDSPVPAAAPTGNEPPRFVAAEGKVELLPGSEVVIGTEIIARIEKLIAREGDPVKQGQVIAILDQTDFKARLQEAEAELAVARAKLKEAEAGARSEELAQAEAVVARSRAEEETARRELDRIQNLKGSGLTTESALDSQTLQHRAASARLKEAEEALAMLRSGTRKETLVVLRESVRRAERSVDVARSYLDKTLIRSPIDGKVLKNDLEEGEVIIPEITLGTVADVERLRVNAEVDETDIGRVTLGADAEITSEAWPGRIVKGKVMEIADYVGPRKVKPNNPARNVDVKVVQVRVSMDDTTGFRPGMTVEIRIHPSGTKP